MRRRLEKSISIIAGQSICLLAVVAISSCGQETTELPATDASLTARVIYRGDYCPGIEPGVDVFSRAESWNDWWRQAESTSGASEAAAAAAANFDFGSGDVLVIAMGQKPTSGYSVTLSDAENSAVIQGETLTIRTIWRQPSDDEVLAQVITSPCVVIGIPKSDFDAVSVIDESAEAVLEKRISER